MRLIRVSPFTQVVDTLLAVAFGGGLIGLGKLLPVSIWGFVGFFISVAVLFFVVRHSHRRIVSGDPDAFNLRVALSDRTLAWTDVPRGRHPFFLLVVVELYSSTTLSNTSKC